MRAQTFLRKIINPKVFILILICSLLLNVLAIITYYYLLLLSISIPIFPPLIIIAKRLSFKKKLEEEFPDFLALILTMEANGLRLDNVFDEALKHKLKLPLAYEIIAKMYSLIKTLNPDPYTGLRYLAKLVPSERISRFLRGYTEILVTTNDTLTYVESKLDEELTSLEQRISRSLSSLDTLYEGLLIILMSIITFMLIPVAYVPKELIALIVSIIGISAYMLSSSLTSWTYRYETQVSQLTSLILLTITPYILLNIGLRGMIIYTFLIIFLTLIFRKIEKRAEHIENDVINLLEDLYSEAKQGIPIDHALMKKENLIQSLKKIRDLLRLGIAVPSILEKLRIPPLSKKLLSLAFSPLEYSRYHEKHLGYTLKIMDYIVRLRRILSERGKMYFFYALTLPIITVVMIKGMTTIQSNLNNMFDPELAVGLTYSISLIAGIIASKISSGKSLYSVLIPVLLIVTLVSFYLANMIISNNSTTASHPLSQPLTTPIGLILTTSLAIPTR